MPGKKSHAKARDGRAKAKTGKPRLLRIVRHTYRVHAGSGSAHVKVSNRRTALKLRARLRAAKVKTLRLSASFTNQQGARQTHRFTVRLRP
jgi:hypothetical protein